ncbi:putative fad binding domain-containing protein [Diplodia seriata]|uniref:Putative fad binding domain-containing protein n=1 Tax=Diplodia seriata TaxID=420778 RepID=A0A0G2ET86_9PEZI|nr:putative fad binding domain-containing protein [Diplodia seriata]
MPRISTLICLLASALLPLHANAATADTTTPNEDLTGFPPCDALIHAGLRDRLLPPTSPSYEARIETWWALNTRLRPWCLIQPHTTAEVSTALTALLNTSTNTTTEYSAGAGDWHIAIRAGGHSANPRANNIDAGVTIDLGALNATTYDSDTNVASIGPGGRWKDVYAVLRERWGVAVAGGRDGGVGVGGFLLGGGLTYFMGRRGFACDAVRGFEVVLANGSIVEATRDNGHGDLWRALKGGGGQFGVVTRFDVEAVPDADLAYGIRFMDAAAHAPALVDVLVDFTDRYEEGSGDALVAFLMYNISVNAGAPVAAAIHVNTDGDGDSPSFAGLNRIPSLQPDSTRAMPLASAAEESRLSSGTWNAGATLSFKNDARILSHALALHSQLTASLSATLGASTFQSTVFLQPLPAFLGAISARTGGNVLGLGSSHHQQQQTRNAIIWTGAVAVTTGPRDLAVARTALMATARELRDFAEGLGGGDGPNDEYVGHVEFPVGQTNSVELL